MRQKLLPGLLLLSGLLWILFRVMKNQKKIVSTQGPLPQRNNNPFALIQEKPSNWQGLVRGSKGFLQFLEPKWGVRAGYINLVNTYLLRGLNTIEKIFPVYAPVSDGNKPDKYIEFVETFTKIKRNSIIDDADKLYIIGRAIERVENGKAWVSSTDWDEGWKLAIPVIKPKLESVQFKAGAKVVAAAASATPLNPFFLFDVLKYKKG